MDAVGADDRVEHLLHAVLELDVHAVVRRLDRSQPVTEADRLGVDGLCEGIDEVGSVHPDVLLRPAGVLPCGIRNDLNAFAARGLEPRIEARVGQISLVEALVGRGVGYGLLMARPNALPMSIAGRPVVVRPFDPPVSVTQVVGIWPDDMELTPRASALLDFAVERLGSFGRGA